MFMILCSSCSLSALFAVKIFHEDFLCSAPGDSLDNSETADVLFLLFFMYRVQTLNIGFLGV